MDQENGIRRRYTALMPLLDERTRRLVLAAEAEALGRGGIAAVARATGASRPMISRGVTELAAAEALPKGRVRRSGAGRKRTTQGENHGYGVVSPSLRHRPASLAS